MGYVYVALAITFWVGLAFSYRWSDRWGASRLLMSPVIGAAAAGWAVTSSLVLGVDFTDAAPSQFVVGATVGVMFAVLIPVFLAALSRGDLSITWMVLALSFALTSILIMIYPGETPTVMGIAGLSLAATAVVLLGLDMHSRHRSNHPGKPKKGWGFFMTLSFVMNSGVQYGFKLAQSMQPADNLAHNVAYILSLYTAVAVTGVVLAVVLARRRTGSLTRAGITGGSVGTCLFFGGMFTLQALSAGDFPGHLLFPATAGGNSTLVALLSVVLLKERPGRFGWAGIVVGIGALTVLGLAA
jgi:hypothetical protein